MKYITSILVAVLLFTGCSDDTTSQAVNNQQMVEQQNQHPSFGETVAGAAIGSVEQVLSNIARELGLMLGKYI